MSTNTIVIDDAPAEPQVKKASEDALPSLISPVWDFFGLGGITLILVPILLALPDSATPAVFALSMLVAHFINHPHFAHSYQIFYRGLRDKLGSEDIPVAFRLRYAFAGFVVPVALAAFLLGSYFAGDVKNLGLAANLMGLLVGWHYVKQGYGMIIVQSVLKRQFLNDTEKKVLMYNAFTTWFFSWSLLNYTASGSDVWGIQAYVFSFDVMWVYLTGAASVITTVAMLYMLARKFAASGGKLPWAGVVAYLVTLYIWMYASYEPKVLYLVPAMHSLQYLTVVWRFQLNYENGQSDDSRFRAFFGDSPAKRFVRFLVVGGLLGYMGFWALPELLNSSMSVDTEVFGTAVFLFVCWIFINVHHYFLDNVMWRRENPETGKYLFAHSR